MLQFVYDRNFQVATGLNLIVGFVDATLQRLATSGSLLLSRSELREVFRSVEVDVYIGHCINRGGTRLLNRAGCSIRRPHDESKIAKTSNGLKKLV